MIDKLSKAISTPYAWPGGYPVYGILDDGELICNDCLQLSEIHEGGNADGWRFEGADVYWEGPTLICPGCNEKVIESAYGDPDADDE